MSQTGRTIGMAITGGTLCYFALIALNGYDSIMLELLAVVSIALAVSLGFDVFDHERRVKE